VEEGLLWTPEDGGESGDETDLLSSLFLFLSSVIGSTRNTLGRLFRLVKDAEAVALGQRDGRRKRSRCEGRRREMKDLFSFLHRLSTETRFLATPERARESVRSAQDTFSSLPLIMNQHSRKKVRCFVCEK